MSLVKVNHTGSVQQADGKNIFFEAGVAIELSEDALKAIGKDNYADATKETKTSPEKVAENKQPQVQAKTEEVKPQEGQNK